MKSCQFGQIVCSLVVVASLFLNFECTANHLYSEGGSFSVLDSDSSSSAQDSSTFGKPGFTDNELQQPNRQYQAKLSPSMEQILEEQKSRRLSEIIAQLRANGQFSQQEIADGPGVFLEEDGMNFPIEQQLPEEGSYWDGMKEKMLENWSKIKGRIEVLLRKGEKLREILNEKCKENKKLWEKLWEAFVEETNELQRLVGQKPTVHWKKLLLAEYSLYSKLCRVAKKLLEIWGNKGKNNAYLEDNGHQLILRRALLTMRRVNERGKNLDKILACGASGESNELSKRHKREWLGRINDALDNYERDAAEFNRVYEQAELESSETIAENGGKKIAPVKKGQNEFVEFVEPQPHQNNRHQEWMDKRIPTDSDRTAHAFHFLTNSGNILFMAYLAVCCFGIVAGTVGGIYYYNHVRASRIDDPFNEFTRYSPAGPGKDKLKKSGSPVFGQSGDDTLAYKAQLQHYQQQKQKILGTASGPVVENMSDNEEDTDEMDHNYSVFECPGLAPTGDLEIQNPNFVGVEKSTAGEAHRAE